MIHVLSPLQRYIRSYVCGKQLCMEESEWIDPIGLHWCEKHRDRYILMKYGRQNAWATIMNEEDILLSGGMESYRDAVKTWKDARIASVINEIRMFVEPMKVVSKT